MVIHLTITSPTLLKEGVMNRFLPLRACPSNDGGDYTDIAIIFVSPLEGRLRGVTVNY
jgi:hypothetical protein